MTQTLTEHLPAKFSKDCGCQGCTFLIRLEAERYDTTWKRKPEPAPTQVVVQTVVEKPKKLQKNEQKIWYDAGRYAEGARDQDAIKGNLRARVLARQ